MTNKTSTIECVDNIYGLATNYLKNHQSKELEGLMNILEELETKFETCEEEQQLKKLELSLKKVLDEMEVIINE